MTDGLEDLSAAQLVALVRRLREQTKTLRVDRDRIDWIEEALPREDTRALRTIIDEQRAAQGGTS